MIILQYHEIFFRLTAARCPGMANCIGMYLNIGAVSDIWLIQMEGVGDHIGGGGIVTSLGLQIIICSTKR